MMVGGAVNLTKTVIASEAISLGHRACA